MSKLRDNKMFYSILFFILAALSSYSVIRLLVDGETLNDLRYFTNLSMVFVFVMVVYLYFGLHNQKIFRYLALITLVNILMTGLIYHFIVNGITNFTNISLDSHVKHTFIPIVYPLFYYLFIRDTVSLKHVWTTLVFPLAYFALFIIVGNFTSWYPYNFMNPTIGNNTLGSVLVFCLLVLLPIIAVFTVILVYLKNLVEKNNK